MNPITKAVDEVKFRIPRDILKQIFQDKSYNWRSTPISIDEQILARVIRPRVLVDCNLVGGTEALISLDGADREVVDSYITIYRIPKDLTQNRSIMSVLSVAYMSSALGAGVAGLSNYKSCSVTPTLVIGQAMMDAFGPIPQTSTARVTLIGENTVLIRDTIPPVGYGYLRCILANDENMSHIQMRSIPPFCKLVELAVKSFIYNEYIVPMDKGQLYGGQELGVFKQIIETYADSEELYQEFLREKWAAIAFMNDNESFTRFLKLNIGGNR